MSLNLAIIAGHISDEPIYKTTTKSPYCRFTVMVQEKVGDKTFSEYIKCVAWGQRADEAAKTFKKGSLVMVSGRVSTRSYEDQAGQKRYVTEINVNNLKSFSEKAAVVPAFEAAEEFSF
jgi:single-strand DNA-binding protein